MEKKVIDPKFLQAADEGYEAYYAGKNSGDCPYEFGSWLMSYWDQGYLTAEDENAGII